ncbi:unnamed protein product [Zymoseptoria tritici ST99CH_3D1]|nr:unnamed protein product [Zymoseptoria tritici ST99CH_3D1]
MEDQNNNLLTPLFIATECSTPSFGGRYLTPSFTSTSTRASASETPHSAHDNKQEEAFDTSSKSDETQEEEKIAQILELELLHDTAGNQDNLELSSRERDIIISELRARIIALEERNARLHAALEEQQPFEQEREHSLGGYRPVLTANNLLHASAQKPSSFAPDDRAKRLASTSTGSPTSSESETSEDGEELDDGGTGRTFADSTPQEIQRQRLQLETTPASVAPRKGNTVIDRPGVALNSKFTFEALVGFSDTGVPLMTGIHDLPDLVLASIVETMNTISSGFYGTQRIPPQPVVAPAGTCAHYWMSGGGKRVSRWSVRRSGLYACSGCARAGRVCLRWMRTGVWRVLPLPEDVRAEGIGYKDDAFWIQNLDSSMFGPRTDCTIWERTELQTKKRKAVGGLEAAA